MCYDPERHHRRSIRLKEYDYTQPGAYFVTICTYDRRYLFGRVVDGAMRLNLFGKIVRDEWFKTSQVRQNVVLYPHEFVVMPNHIHGIVRIVDNIVGAQRRCAPTCRINVTPGSLGAIVRAFKSAAARRINQIRNTFGQPVWQRNYYEHIIRNEGELNRIRGYIVNNPPRWHLDRENLERVGEDEFDRWLDNLGGKT
ncbi:MAG: transposase [Candidatus Latescibacteria bacterium]|nr:transposase [Candidatus Latescibacterota bacterium]